ncbi:hypothetical protein ACIBF5_04640 [Micromonospora sp. NPDC050417]
MNVWFITGATRGDGGEPNYFRTDETVRRELAEWRELVESTDHDNFRAG